MAEPTGTLCSYRHRYVDKQEGITIGRCYYHGGYHGSMRHRPIQDTWNKSVPCLHGRSSLILHFSKLVVSLLNFFTDYMVQRILGFLFLALMVSAFVQCARRGAPSGGIKDIIPPKLISAEPNNMTINFKESKIRLYFDEYIKLKDLEKQLIVSPPLKHQPIITPQGSPSKYVEIIIKDTLRPNTTYTFNFGQSIVDNNEGNPSSY